MIPPLLPRLLIRNPVLLDIKGGTQFLKTKKTTIWYFLAGSSQISQPDCVTAVLLNLHYNWSTLRGFFFFLNLHCEKKVSVGALNYRSELSLTALIQPVYCHHHHPSWLFRSPRTCLFPHYFPVCGSLKQPYFVGVSVMIALAALPLDSCFTSLLNSPVLLPQFFLFFLVSLRSYDVKIQTQLVRSFLVFRDSLVRPDSSFISNGSFKRFNQGWYFPLQTPAPGPIYLEIQGFLR